MNDQQSERCGGWEWTMWGKEPSAVLSPQEMAVVVGARVQPMSGWLYVCWVHGSQSIPDNYRSFAVYFMSGLSRVLFLKVFLAILTSIFIEDEPLYRKRINHKCTAQQIFPK